MNKMQKRLMREAQELMDLPLPDTFEGYIERGLEIAHLLFAAGDPAFLAALEKTEVEIDARINPH